MAFYRLLTAFGALIGSLPVWLLIPLEAIYILFVPFLMIWIAIGLTAAGRASHPAWSAGVLLRLSTPRLYWIVWVSLLMACIAETLLCVATYTPGARFPIEKLTEAIFGRRNSGLVGCAPLFGVIAGLWSLCVLPRARRFALGEDNEN